LRANRSARLGVTGPIRAGRRKRPMSGTGVCAVANWNLKPAQLVAGSPRHRSPGPGL